MQATPRTVIRFLGITLAVAAILFLVWYFSSIVIYILISAILAIICRPLVCRMSRLHIKGWRFPRWLAAMITLIIIWMVFATLGSLFIPLIFNKIQELSSLDFGKVISSVSEPISKAQEYVNSLFAISESTLSLPDAITSSLKSLINIESINTVFSSLLNLALSATIAIFSISFITFFFLKDDGLFYDMITSIFPQKYHDKVTSALDSVTNLLSRYFTGVLTESAILMLTVSLTMMAFGMYARDAFFIGLIMGVMNVVPYAGPLIGGVIAIFMGIVSPIDGMSVGHTMTIIAGSLLIIKGFDDFVLQPTLYSSRVKAHPLEIFIVILIAGSVAGIVGMLLAIPSYTILRVFAKEFFSQFSLVKKLTNKI